MKKKKKNDDTILYDQTDTCILEEVEDFCCNLHKQRDTDDADSSSLNAQLSQEDSGMIEGNYNGSGRPCSTAHNEK